MRRTRADRLSRQKEPPNATANEKRWSAFTPDRHGPRCARSIIGSAVIGGGGLECPVESLLRPGFRTRHVKARNLMGPRFGGRFGFPVRQASCGWLGSSQEELSGTV